MSKIIEAKTPKGFRDFLPSQQRQRNFVVEKLKKVFESFGFEPLETPAIEYAETLEGKYGEDEKLIYKFEDRGGRMVALRYDQTVPLARVVAQYRNLPKPFKRYQIQPAWRGENPQKGRFREFLQCDFDTVGSDSPLADAETITVVITAMKMLGFKNFKVLISNRKLLTRLMKESGVPEDKIISAITAVDKLSKIGSKKVTGELVERGIPKETAVKVLTTFSNAKPSEELMKVFEYLSLANLQDYFSFEPSLARGLNYYTGTIFELKVDGYEAGSLGGGGRYDNLIGLFTGQNQPAVGFSFGFDRLLEALDQFNLLPSIQGSARVLITIFNEALLPKSLEVSSLLRESGVNNEIYLDYKVKLEKQLKYADNKNIPYVVIIGPEEAEKNEVTLKNLLTKEQKRIAVDQLKNFIR
ncbi:MAG: histidine--tRNA ligase [Patescibacteria group bacterium]|nr:histidine--tRNA ligase [Patescibacteria group bacterium]